MKQMLLVVVALLLASSATAQAPAGKGWVALFNGKSLDGWINNGQEKWVVADGTILGESTVGHYGYLTTEKTYGNFVLRVKFKPETDGNSGVFTRSRITGNSAQTGPDIEGMQIEVDPTRKTGSIYESGHRGWVALGTPACEQAIRPREWNELEITEQGLHYVTRLNDVPCVDFTDPHPNFTNGVVGLQLHTGGGVRIRFKDVYLKELGTR
jgi:Domain of Unknown Function (DUF1080)